MMQRLVPIHPGEVPLEEFLKLINLSQNQLAIMPTPAA
jgi:plasmid maintenance system antidote protein VapI